MKFIRMLLTGLMAITEKIIQGAGVGAFGRDGQTLYGVDTEKI